MKKILIITDNGWIYERISAIIDIEFRDNRDIFEFRRSPAKKYGIYEGNIKNLKELNISENLNYIISTYDKVISAHCKQIFPKKLVENVVCINFHPGYNPYNRGWYPQVFSIINQTPTGATVHIMDEEIDNGDIIARKEVIVNSWDTSKDVYERVLSAEMELFRNIIIHLVNNTYEIFSPEFVGKYHSINDFKELCSIDLNEKLSMGEAINKLRALTHGEYNNAYFIDKNGNKIYVKINLQNEVNEE